MSVDGHKEARRLTGPLIAVLARADTIIMMSARCPDGQLDARGRQAESRLKQLSRWGYRLTAV